MNKRNWRRNALSSAGNGILGLWLALTAIAPASAEPYRLEIAAHLGMVIDGYTITELNFEGGGPYSISDQGEIAFIAGVTSPDYTGYAVMTNRRLVAKDGDVIDGRVLTTVLDEDAVPMINNLGQVSYRAEFDDRGPSRGIYTLVFDNRIIAEPGMNVGGHVLANNISLGATLDDVGRALFWATTANSTETGVPAGMFSLDGLLWSNGPQQVAGEEALGAWHFVSLNGQHHGLYVFLPDDAVPGGDIRAIATPSEILVREGQILDGNRRVTFVEPWYMTNDGEIVARVNSDWVLLPGYTDIFAAAGAPRDRIVGIPAAFGDGRFAYLATMPDRPGRGLFVGDQLIVAAGDIIGGKTLTDLNTSGGFFPLVNSKGNIVLSAEFSDGTDGYITATVIPEPSAGAMALAGLVATALLLAVSRRRRLRHRGTG